MLEDLKAKALAARKLAARKDAHPVESQGASTLAKLLTSVLADADKRAKDDGARATNDADAEAALKGFLKGVEQSLEAVTEPDKRQSLLAEKDALSAFLPEPLDAQALHNAIRATANVCGVAVELKHMKAIKANLEATYPGRIDGRMLAEQVKAWSG